MKKFGLLRTACVVGVSTACIFNLTACSGASGVGDDAVAATVNGVAIKESDVTKYIDEIRGQYNLSDEASWGSFLAQQQTTPEEMRQDILDEYFIPQQIINQFAGDEGVEVTDEEVNTYVEQTKSQISEGETDANKVNEKWEKALSEVGMTEETYRNNIKIALQSQKLQEKLTPPEEETPSQELLEEATTFATNYDGAKRSSHILFKAEDEALANEVLGKINNGELDFVAAVQEYSQDPGSKQTDGDIGWDKTSPLVAEYTDALNQLSKDQVSGLVTSEFGIHIIKCTDVYTAPKTAGEDGAETISITSLDQLPSDLAETVKTNYSQRMAQQSFEEWMTAKKESSEIVINPMPENASYMVDVEKYKQPETESPEGQVVTNEDGSTTVTTTSEGNIQITEGEGSSEENAAPSEEKAPDAAA